MPISDPIGFIVGEVETHRFVFVTSRDLAPPRLEYVVVPGVRETTPEGTRQVDVLAQVTRLQAASPMLDASHTYGETQALIRGAYDPPPRILATADVLGYLLKQDGRASVRVPRCTPLPGQDVCLAPDELLQEFFTNNVASGIEAGTLVNRPTVPVLLDPNGLRRHLAVIAQTGAGKSYLSGVVLEQLLKLGGTVIVFDPNSDYVRLRFKPDSQTERTSFEHLVDIYRVPGVEGRRYGEREVGGSKPYTVRFSDLDTAEICSLAGISENSRNIRHAILKACEGLRAENSDYGPSELKSRLEVMAGLEKPATDAELAAVKAVEDVGEDEDVFGNDTIVGRLNERAGRKPSAVVTDASASVKEGAEKAIKYVEDLASYKIWGFQDVNMDDLLRPMRLSVVDLAGMEQYVAQYAVQRALAEIWRRATTGRLAHPVFVVLEEAHNFVSAGGRGGECARWINRVASEGRKFKVFLVVITQRPGKIDPDTLSQCGSQVIMKLTNPTDQEAVRRASESLSESLFGDLPGLNTGEAIVVGQLTRVPVMMRVGRRESAEGGSDVDVVKALEAARSDNVTRKFEQTSVFAEADRSKRTEIAQEI